MGIYALIAEKGGEDMDCKDCRRSRRCQMNPETCSQKMAEGIVMEPEHRKRVFENRVISGYERMMRRRYQRIRYEMGRRYGR